MATGQPTTPSKEDQTTAPAETAAFQVGDLVVVDGDTAVVIEVLGDGNFAVNYNDGVTSYEVVSATIMTQSKATPVEDKPVTLPRIPAELYPPELPRALQHPPAEANN